MNRRAVLGGFGGLALLPLSGLAASCATPPAGTPADRYALRSSLGTGRMALSWAPVAQPGGGYDVQRYVGSDVWSTVGSTTDASFTVTGLAHATWQKFRIRTARVGTTAAGAWSVPHVAMYAELVMPVLRIDTASGAPIVSKETYLPATMQLDPNGAAVDAFSGTLEIKGRGNSTWTYPKKPYRLKLAKSTDLMGMGANKNWVLLANMFDRSALRTWATTDLADATDLQWSPRNRWVEVVLNGEYIGLYQLAEHVRIAANRVNIDELKPTDVAGVALTGGYLLEIDFRLEENHEPGFRTTRGEAVVIGNPDPATSEQFQYIRRHVQAFEDAVFSHGFADPATGYRRYLHLPTFIDHYWVQEVTRNQDAFVSSTFMFKRRGDDLIYFGPPWDFDSSLGTMTGAVPCLHDGWWARTRGYWNPRLFTDATLVQAVNQRWRELKPGFVAVASTIEAKGAELAPVVATNLARWYSWAPTEADNGTFIGEWLLARIAWIDAQVGSI